MEIEMKFKEKFEDILAMKPMIILSGVSTDHILRIWIGEYEKEAIDLILGNKLPPRPLTHVLMCNIINTFGTLKRVSIIDLKKIENSLVFIAHLEILTPSGELKIIDARSSDAIILALLCNVPIFVNLSILEKIPKNQWDPKGTGAIFILPPDK